LYKRHAAPCETSNELGKAQDEEEEEDKRVFISIFNHLFFILSREVFGTEQKNSTFPFLPWMS
jgi:hypothetical protein